jgi:nuclear pore complex protein Nup205
VILTFYDADVRATITYHTSTLSLLLRLAQGRHGATALLNAGLFSSIRASALFSTDPDIGLDVDNSAALKIFFELMLALLKVVAAVLMARGVENEQMKATVREFLSENRTSVVAVFKRNAKIGWGNGTRGVDGVKVATAEENAMNDVLSECVDMYSLLISAAGWLEVS